MVADRAGSDSRPRGRRSAAQGAESLKGRLLVGTINSIGVRRDAGAVEPLTGHLKDQDADVASAAAVALGRIGNAAATKALRESLAGAPAKVRSAVAEGCILCAERLLADGKDSEAAEIYDEVRKADVPKQKVSRRLAARFSPARPREFRCWSSSSARKTRDSFTSA